MSQPPTPSVSGASLIDRMNHLKTTGSTTSMDSQGTVTSPEGPISIDPQMYARFMKFNQMEEQEQAKAKRKREKSGSTTKPKKKRPLLTEEMDKIYKLARNAMGREFKFQAQLTALKKYINMEDHMVPPPHKVSLSILLSPPLFVSPTYTSHCISMFPYSPIHTAILRSCTFRSRMPCLTALKMRNTSKGTKLLYWHVKNIYWRPKLNMRNVCSNKIRLPKNAPSLSYKPSSALTTMMCIRSVLQQPRPVQKYTESGNTTNRKSIGLIHSATKNQPLLASRTNVQKLLGNATMPLSNATMPSPPLPVGPHVLTDNTCAPSAACQQTTTTTLHADVHKVAEVGTMVETMPVPIPTPWQQPSISPWQCMTTINGHSAFTNYGNQNFVIINQNTNQNNNNNDSQCDNSENSDNIVNPIVCNETDGTHRREALCTCKNNTTDHVEIKFFEKIKVVCLNNKDDRCVINLSSHDLNRNEWEVLQKGLTFCPTPGEPLLHDIINDLKAFFRRLKLRAHYYEEEDPIPNTQPTLDSFLDNNPQSHVEVDVSRFTPKSTWEPKSENVDPAIETFCRAVLKELKDYNPICPRSNNLTKDQKDALFSLENNKTIKIQKADKGSATVVMDLEDYIKEAHRQLSDTNYYVKTSVNRTDFHSQKIGEILSKMLEKGEIDRDTYSGLVPGNCRTARFYFLPKIHKKLVVGRPIISGNGCPTEQISAFVDEHIKPYVPTFPSYVRDTTDFISKLSRLQTDRNQKKYLVSLDVTGLYTNIPNQEGKNAVYRTLIEHNYNGQVSINSIMKLLECVLHMNNFEFCDENYLQIGGTAMGTKLAPSYSCLYLSYLEKKLLETAPCKPDLYLRFIDDIFCVFSCRKALIEQFITHMNNSHNTIKFTSEISEESITFLDTKVIIDPETQEIYTELYTKDTDTHNYLSFDSCHPKHCKTGGPYGEFLRIRRNCQKIDDYDKHSRLRVNDYERRGYPTDLLEEARLKARNLNRHDLLKQKTKSTPKEKDRVPLIMTHNPANPNMRSIIDKHWHLLELCTKKEAFKEKPLISYRRNKNLADHLVRAKCSKPQQNDRPKQNPNIRPCNTPWYCKFCPKRDSQTHFKSSITKRSYKNPPYTCNTRNVVYLITCSLCKKQYVGETYRSFKDRMIEHERYVKRKYYTEATGVHYNLAGHRLGHMNYEVIYCLWKKPEPNDPIRVQHEIKWMNQLKTFKPEGLNDKGKAK